MEDQEAGKDNEKRGSKRRGSDAFLDSFYFGESGQPYAAPGLDNNERIAMLIKEITSTSAAAACPNAKDAPSRKALLVSMDVLVRLAKNEDLVDAIVDQLAVDAVVPLLNFQDAAQPHSTFAMEVKEKAAWCLNLMAIKPEHQRQIADKGSLPHLVKILKDYAPTVGRESTDKPAESMLGSLLHRGSSKPAPTERNASNMQWYNPPAKRHKGGVASACHKHGAADRTTPSCASLIRRVADAVTNLAHDNFGIKTKIKDEGGLEPLVALLGCYDSRVQRSTAGALRTLSFKHDVNKEKIVEYGALPLLICMLRSDDELVHYEAVGAIGNLVHSSNAIKKKVLEEGALQPVISLLSSRCAESQREAALLLGQFCSLKDATAGDYRNKIAQRGAIRPLVTMLGSSDPQLREMAAFALGRLAQDVDNQAGIVQAGGLRPLLDLLDSSNGGLQHNAAFALYGLADNVDNVCEVVREGGVTRLMNAELIVQQSRDCVQKMLKRLEEKVHNYKEERPGAGGYVPLQPPPQGQPPQPPLTPDQMRELALTSPVLRQLLQLLRCKERSTQQRCAVTLAHLCVREQAQLIFLHHGGLDVLLGMLSSHSAAVQKESCAAIYALCKKVGGQDPLVTVGLPPAKTQVYLGEKYVNGKTLSDVTFLVEGRIFYAHRIALFASSEVFGAMFEGGYKEKGSAPIEIPNIRYDVFEAMMRCIYTGNVDVTPEIAHELLRAADQYLLGGLKRLCERALAEHLTMENVVDVYELAETFHADALRNMCVLFFLENHARMIADTE
eukprot:jgi/Mesvir1/26428/Mv16117-RA.2